MEDFEKMMNFKSHRNKKKKKNDGKKMAKD